MGSFDVFLGRFLDELGLGDRCLRSRANKIANKKYYYFFASTTDSLFSSRENSIKPINAYSFSDVS